MAPPRQLTPEELNQHIELLVQNAHEAVAKGVQSLLPKVDANPKGLEAIVLSAVLRAYADLIELPFEENGKGPLTSTVDNIRQRLFAVFRSTLEQQKRG